MSENTNDNEPVQVVTILPPDGPEHLSKGAIIRATKWRRAIKRYNGEHISDEDWDFILEMGRLAPSSMGLEAWNMIDITNQELMGKVSAAAWGIGKKFPGFDHLVVYTVKNDLLPQSEYFHQIMVAEGYSEEAMAAKVARNKSFQDHDQELTDDWRRRDWAIRQVYIAATQMMVGASLIGVDSTPIEGFPLKDVSDVLVDAGVLDPETDSAVYMYTFGFRDGEPWRPKTRRPLSQIVKTVK
jgi:nitroreductase